jgi:regulator of sigma E protease
VDFYPIVAETFTRLIINGTNVLWAVLGLGLVIFLHELGHFAVAKWCNVLVERFSIGFGPVLFSRKWGETEYALSLIPFGGYVKMLGQDDADPSQMTSEEIAADPRSYVAKNVWQRMAIISAGVATNVVTAIVFYAMAFGIGRRTEPPIIGDVRPGMPAWVAGITRGDEITHINGRKVTSFRELALSVAVSTGALELKGKHRDGTEFTAMVEPDVSGTRPAIGIMPSSSLQLISDLKDAKSPVRPGTPADRAEPGFQPGDTIVAVNGQKVASFADFQDAIATRDPNSSTITVVRKSGSEAVTMPIGASYFRTLGLRLDSGPLSAVRVGSPADKAGLKPGDKLAKIHGRDIGTDLDPLRLSEEVAKLAGEPIEIVATRQNPTGGQEEVRVTVTPEPRKGWIERPEAPGEPLTIPAIGVAFHVVPFILQVEPGSPAETAGVPTKVAIEKLELILPPEAAPDIQEKREWGFSLKDTESRKDSNNFGFAFWMLQQLPNRHVRLTLTEKDQPKVVTVIPAEDPSWMLPTIGVRMTELMYDERAKNPIQAVSMAWTQSWNTVINIYQTLRSLITSRLSYKELHGPIGIARAAYDSAKMGPEAFLFFLGFLSLNLAVLNFLPIPVLDGGHMVFLLYEAITRRRPSEQVLVAAVYAGMIFLFGLMALVLYLDIFEHRLGFGP